MKYYLHDSNSFNDEKITQLFMEFGYEGLGLFYTLLEKIASQEKPIITSVLKSQLRVGKKLEKCWKFMESIELIHSIDGETYNLQLMKFSEKYRIKKEKTSKRVAKFRDKQEVTNHVTCYNHDSNGHKENENEEKGNEVIKQQSKMSDMTHNEKFLISISEEWRLVVTKWLDYKKEKNQPYKGFTSLTTMFKRLVSFSNNDPITGAEIIENSISNNYSGFFKPTIKLNHQLETGKTLQPKTDDAKQTLLNRLK